MNQGLLYGILFTIIVLLLAVVVYYGFRLAKAGKAAEGTAQRFQLFMQRQMKMEEDLQATVTSQVRPNAVVPGVDSAVAPAGGDRVFERTLDLQSLSPDPIFIRRSKEGATLVQIADRPSIPLSYVLDPRSRRILMEVVGLASSDFGLEWAILAKDGEDGKLSITRVV